MSSSLMVIIYNQSSQDVWFVDRMLTQGSFSDVHDTIPKGYSYASVATNATGYISGSFNIKNKGNSNVIANALFSFDRGVRKTFDLFDQKQDGLEVTHKVLTPDKLTTDGDVSVEVNLQSTLTVMVFVNDA